MANQDLNEDKSSSSTPATSTVASAPVTGLDRFFEITKHGSNTKTELIAGLTTFLAMVYSAVAVPSFLRDAGFPADYAFIATCLLTAFGSLIMGLWAKLPMAIGGDIVLSAFVAYSMVLGQHLTIPVVIGAVFGMGVLFTVISVTGIRAWILRNLPASVAHGAGIGIGLFLLLIAASNVGLVVYNNTSVIPVKLGNFSSIPVLFSLLGLFLIVGLERRQVKGSILLVIIIITILGVIFDPKVQYNGFFHVPSFDHSLFFHFDLKSMFSATILPTVFALVITAVFDATGTIRAVAGQANLVDEKGLIKNGNRALASDSFSSVFAGCLGTAPAAVYIESCAGTAAGGKTGLVPVVCGVLFLCIIFFQPLAILVPAYATAPALMYVGLLMMQNIRQLHFDDTIGTMAGLVTAVFIVLTANIVTGLMLGFVSLVIGRIVAGEYKKLNIGTVIIAVGLFLFYLFNFDIR